MKKLALIALLSVAGMSHALYVATDTTPVRRDIVTEDPAMLGTMYGEATTPMVAETTGSEPMVTPADNNYYYTPYGNRPVANTVAGASDVAAEAVSDAGSAAASVIPF